MNLSEPVIPKRIYIEIIDPENGTPRRVVSPDRLISWAEEERGGVVDRWCRQVCDEQIDAINSWKDDRILELEDDWADSGTAIDDEDEDADEARFHLACEAVVTEARWKCTQARERMSENRAAIDQLVRQAREYKTDHTPPPQEYHYAGYLIALAALAAVTYVLLT